MCDRCAIAVCELNQSSRERQSNAFSRRLVCRTNRAPNSEELMMMNERSPKGGSCVLSNNSGHEKDMHRGGSVEMF